MIEIEYNPFDPAQVKFLNDIINFKYLTQIFNESRFLFYDNVKCRCDKNIIEKVKLITNEQDCQFIIEFFQKILISYYGKYHQSSSYEPYQVLGHLYINHDINCIDKMIKYYTFENFHNIHISKTVILTDINYDYDSDYDYYDSDEE